MDREYSYKAGEANGIKIPKNNNSEWVIDTSEAEGTITVCAPTKPGKPPLDKVNEIMDKVNNVMTDDDVEEIRNILIKEFRDGR